MPVRRLQCAIEQVVDWHPHLFVEPHVVAFVAVAGKYSDSPASFQVNCENISSRWLRDVEQFRLSMSWHADTAKKAERLRATMQSGPLLELGAIALALVLSRRILALGELDVTNYGERADYRSRKRRAVLEMSGTEVDAEFSRRHRQKVAQAQQNPFGWDAYVTVCAFSPSGHRIRLSGHPFKEVPHGQG
jgi:hypothetical protein